MLTLGQYFLTGIMGQSGGYRTLILWIGADGKYFIFLGRVS